MLKKVIKLYKKRFCKCEDYARFIGVKIGKGCLISTKLFSSEPYLIKIGNYCRIAKDVSFYTHGGLWSMRKKFPNLDYFGKIDIGDYTYIGESAKILPGVTIGSNVIIGAGSVVTKSVPTGKIAAGNPARIVGDTEDFILKIQNFNVNTYGMSSEVKRNFLLVLEDIKFIKK
jgi:acetyltransferase-like isoleucine patch superfamily enzyme